MVLFDKINMLSNFICSLKKEADNKFALLETSYIPTYTLEDNTYYTLSIQVCQVLKRNPPD